MRDPFKLKKRRQLFIGMNHVTFTIVAMRVSNKDYSPLESVSSYDDGAADDTTGLTGHKVRALVRREAPLSASDTGPFHR